MPYISAWPIPARQIATGMSRRGSTISSAAVEGSSTPTNRIQQNRTIAMKTAWDG